MAWVRLDDGYFENPKVLQLAELAGPLALALDLAGMAWSSRNRTDGFVPKQALGTLVPALGRKGVTKALNGVLAVGRWTARADGSGYEIHDFLTYNPSAAQRDKHAQRNRQRQDRFRSRNGVIRRAKMSPGRSAGQLGEFQSSESNAVTPPSRATPEIDLTSATGQPASVPRDAPGTSRNAVSNGGPLSLKGKGGARVPGDTPPAGSDLSRPVEPGASVDAPNDPSASREETAALIANLRAEVPVAVRRKVSGL